MAENFDLSKLKEMLNDMIPADLDVERVFQKMTQPPYRGKVSFRHLKNMDPDDFNRLSSVAEIIKWFRKYPSKFVLFENDVNRVRMCGVRIPSAKICLEYQSTAEGSDVVGCTDEECYKFHICRKFVAGHCKDGPRCSYDHHFQSEHNRRLLTKQGLDTYNEDDLLVIFFNSQLRVCDMYNTSRGFCQYQDGCMRLHLCDEFVRGRCAGDCKLNHSIDDSEHTKRLRRYYALDDKPLQEVLRNLLIVRRKPAGGTTTSGHSVQKADVEKLLQLLTSDVSTSPMSTSRQSDTETSATQESAETSVSSSSSSAAAAVTPGGSSPPVASWQLELFGTWTTFSDAESAQIEKAYCDPNIDSFVMSTVLSELGGSCHLVTDLSTMTASLLLDDDGSRCEGMKLKRVDGTSQWSWYWQHDDDSWRSYTEVESAQIEAKYQKKEIKFDVGDRLRYTINLSKMTQTNKTSGRVRYIRRRPKPSAAQP